MKFVRTLFAFAVLSAPFVGCGPTETKVTVPDNPSPPPTGGDTPVEAPPMEPRG